MDFIFALNIDISEPLVGQYHCTDGLNDHPLKVNIIHYPDLKLSGITRRI